MKRNRVKEIEVRVLEVTKYIIDTKSTIRATAKVFGVSKATVYKDITERILEINPVLAVEVEKILLYNKQQSHYRGGEASKRKREKINGQAS